MTTFLAPTPAKTAAQPDVGLREEIAQTEVMIAQALQHLDAVCQELRQDEQELESFLDDYYQKVGKWFEVLELIRAELRGETVSRKELAVAGSLPTGEQEPITKEIDKEIKTIYRKLVKMYHPDSQPTPRGKAQQPAESKHIIQVINSAYARKDLSDLRRIEFDMFRRSVTREGSAEESLRCLSARYDTIVASAQRIDTRRDMLRQSPAWVLKNRLDEAMLSGEDLVGDILARVRSQIEEGASKLRVAKRESEALKALKEVALENESA